MEKVIVWKATRSARGPLGSKVAVNWTKRAAPRSESSFVYVRLGTSTRWKAAPRTGPSAPLLGGGALLGEGVHSVGQGRGGPQVELKHLLAAPAPRRRHPPPEQLQDVAQQGR